MRLILSILAGVLLPGTAFAAPLPCAGDPAYCFAFRAWADKACNILPYCNTVASASANHVAIATGIVINAILWAIGSAAVLIILYAAIRLVTSGGNEETVRKAWKETILYACLGLLFAVLADVIVNYVIGLVSGIAAS